MLIDVTCVVIWSRDLLFFKIGDYKGVNEKLNLEKLFYLENAVHF